MTPVPPIEAAGPNPFIVIATLGFVLLCALSVICSLARLFYKAGLPAWHAFVPILNIATLLHMCGRSRLWLLLLLVPLLGFVPALLGVIELPARFGKPSSFRFGLILLPPLFFPLLALGEASYTPPQT